MLHDDLTNLESARLHFYRAVVRLVRAIGGEIVVAISAESERPTAALCWLPPKHEPTVWNLFGSGFLTALLWLGVRGAYRFVFFEYTLSRLYGRTLASLGYKSRSEGAFVQILATDPTYGGKGLSAGLLEWQIEKHVCLYPGTPVFLDTSADYSKRVYERVGFRELGRQQLNVDRSSVLQQHSNTDFVHIVMMWEPRSNSTRVPQHR